MICKSVDCRQLTQEPLMERYEPVVVQIKGVFPSILT
jgi:hypothetical protein